MNEWGKVLGYGIRANLWDGTTSVMRGSLDQQIMTRKGWSFPVPYVRWTRLHTFKSHAKAEQAALRMAEESAVPFVGERIDDALAHRGAE